MPEAGDTVLAIDIGGTKMLGALVRGKTVSDVVHMPTPSSGEPHAWIESLLAAAPEWSGRYGRVGAAVTGLVDDGHWMALNRATLSLPDRYPLVSTLQALTGKPAVAINDAQAAAWGEFSFGAGQGTQNLVFLTVSTGIGGGVVAGGRLLVGLAGHFGQLKDDIASPAPLESFVAGRYMAEAAKEAGVETDARGVFQAADAGEDWAAAIRLQSARRVATLCANIQLMLAPEKIVIGGSIGLAPGFIGQIDNFLEPLPAHRKPALRAAELGAQAGLIGVAALAAQPLPGKS